jgi:hypothetical protein
MNQFYSTLAATALVTALGSASLEAQCQKTIQAQERPRFSQKGGVIEENFFVKYDDEKSVLLRRIIDWGNDNTLPTNETHVLGYTLNVYDDLKGLTDKQARARLVTIGDAIFERGPLVVTPVPSSDQARVAEALNAQRKTQTRYVFDGCK